MRNLLMILLTGALLGAPAVVCAQASTETKTKFYNFDDLLINGQFKKPKGVNIDSKQKAKFEKLLRLKKDFLPSLKATAKDSALR